MRFINYRESVYVGATDKFQKLLKVEKRDVRANLGLNTLGDFCQPRLIELYQKIITYI